MKKNYKRNWLFKLKSLAVFGSLLFASAASAQMSGMYTIDTSMAQTSSNFHSFSEMADSIDVLGVNGPVTITATPIVFSESFELLDFAGSSLANTVTIDGNGATLDNNAAEIINLEDATFITIKNLIMRNTNANGECMVIQEECKNILVDNCEFIKTGSRTGSGSIYLNISEGATAFTNGSATKENITITNNYFHNGGGSNTTGGYVGINVCQSLDGDDDENIVIANNEISCWGRYAINLEDVNGVHVEDNEIYNPANYAQGFRAAIYHFMNFNSESSSDQNSVIGNYIHDLNPTNNAQTQYGIQWYAYYGESKVNIDNNIIDLQGNGTMYAIFPYSAFPGNGTRGDKNIRHNTINLAGNAGSTFRTVAGVYSFYGDGSQFTNNIITTAIPTARNVVGIYNFQGGVNNNNNIYFDNGATVDNERYTAPGNFNQGPATAAEYLLQNPNGVSTDPLYTNPAGDDYTPQSLGMANKGAAIPTITTDINKDSRNATTPDLGAVEYFVDIEVVSVDMTSSLSECAPLTESVVATFKNNGPNPASGIPVRYSVNGGGIVEETINVTIASGASYQYTFDRVPEFFGSNTHVVNVAVNGVDEVPANSDGSYTLQTTVSPTGGDLTMGTLFGGYFETGTEGDMDVVVNNYISNYDITDPTSATNYSYTVNATNERGMDVTSSGFSLINGDKGVQMNPTLALAGDSIFVQIEVTDNSSGCDTSFGRFVYVPHVPVADFQAADICLGDLAQFKNLSTLAGDDFIGARWEFNDPDASILGDTSGIVDGFWEYSAFSTAPINVDMTVFNAVYPKFRYLVSKQINITPTPVIDFKVLNACEGVAISVLNTTRLPNDPNTGMPVAGTISYDWDFGGEFSSTAVSPTHTFTTAGQRDLTLVASANGCESMQTKNAYQFERPEAVFSSEGACNFVPVSFINESIIENNGNMGYQWDFNGEGIARADNPMFAFATPGTKTVTLTATSEFGCENTTTRTVTLEESPEADFTWEEACNLTPVSFTRTGSVPLGGVNSDFFWDFDGESTTTQENPEHLFSNLGLREVTLTIVDGNGCTNAITKEVNVVLEAVADFQAEDACSGEEVVFTNTSEVAAGGLDYEWRFGDDNTSSDLNPTHIYGEAKTYDVTLSANVEGGCSSEVTKTVTVFESPDAGFTINKGGREVSVTASDATNDTYNWTFGNGSRATSAAANNTYNNVDEGTFTICLATRKGICWSENCDEVTINLAGVENLTQANDMISVYPNPSQGQFTVAVDNASEVVVKVGDILGNVIAANVIDNLNGTYSIDMSAVADGVYFVQVKNGDFYATKRITISK